MLMTEVYPDEALDVEVSRLHNNARLRAVQQITLGSHPDIIDDFPLEEETTFYPTEETPIPNLQQENETWRKWARCKEGNGALLQIFFSEDKDGPKEAKKYCTQCPVREQCLNAARRRREPEGVWGGELFSEGRIVGYTKRRRSPTSR